MSLTAQQIATRRQGIGGSDAAAAVGLSPWRTPYDLWLEKTGQIEPPDLSDNEAVHFGHVLEQVVADEFTRRTGRKLRRVNRTIVHPKFPFMLAHFDRDVIGEPEGFEAKTVGLNMAAEWGEEGTDEIPVPVLIQCSHYLACKPAYTAWNVGALIAGQRFRAYRVERDVELIDTLTAREGAFWKHVEDRTPPDPLTLDDAKRRWPFETVASAPTDIPTLEAVQKLRILKKSLAEQELAITEQELAVKTFMGEAGQLVDRAGKVLCTWRAQTANRLDQKLLAANHPDIFEACKTAQQSRVFRLK